MSSHPNTLLVASIRPPSGQPDEFLGEDLGEGLELVIGGESYEVYTTENTEMGIYPVDESFAVYEYLTYGWGDTTELGEALAKIEKFKMAVQDYCEANNCTYRLDLTANFW